MKPFLLLLLTALALHASDRPPNVVIIFCDDMGYGDPHCFGAPYATPNLDRLAAEGRKFTSFHVSSAVCSASRAALLTGCYHGRVGIHGALGPGSRIGLNPDETTIAEVLKQKNYATGIVCKWHLGSLPQFLPMRQGFDEWLGLPYSNDMWPHHPEAKPGTFPDLPMYDGDKITIPAMTHGDQNQMTTRYTERAVSFIEKNKEHPFFLYLAHSMPHVPLHVSEKFAGKSGAGLYGDVIQEIDWSVGQVLDALKRSGVDDNTWIIFSSDNGPWLSYGEHAGSAGPLREGKGTSWDGGVRVPCIMRWPGKIPAGTTCDTFMMTIDMLPTIAVRTGTKLPERKIDGLDVWPLIAGEPGAKNPHRAYAIWYANNELQTVTDGRWKLLLPHLYRTLGDQPKAKGGIPAKYHNLQIEKPELYDLTGDIGEAHDVSAEHPDVMATLTAFANEMRSELGDSLTKTPASAARPPGTAAK